MIASMKYSIELPTREKIKFRYTNKVYSPKFTAMDTIVVADKIVENFDPLEGTRVLDVGCGSGVLGLSLKYLKPELAVALIDTSEEAVKQTKINAKQLGLNVSIKRMDLRAVTAPWDMIVANLPTYDREQMGSERLHGPEDSYWGGEDGMDLYRILFKEATSKCIVCECQKKHQERFLEIAKEAGWELILRTNFSFAFKRV